MHSSVQIHCNACGQEAISLPISGHFEHAKGRWDYQLYRCSQCGHGQVEPQPSVQTLEALYSGYQSRSGTPEADSLGGRLKNRVGALAAARHLASIADALVRPVVKMIELAAAVTVPLSTSVPASLQRDTPILDFGCGSGLWLLRMKHLGFSNLFGHDFDYGIWKDIRDRGISISTGEIDNIPKVPFGCVRLHHVLEHLPNPIETLTRLGQMLAPGGSLVVGVPNYGAWSAQALAGHWPALVLPHHLNHFTDKSLRLAVERAGFRPIETQRNPVFASAEPAMSLGPFRLLPKPMLRRCYYIWALWHRDGENLECWAQHP